MDMATSVFSNGKLGIARRQGRAVPPGAFLDKEGRPSTNPEDWAAGGPMLPAGGYKGYALGLLNLFLAALSMVGVSAGERVSGTFFLALNVDAFQPLEEYAHRSVRRPAEGRANARWCRGDPAAGRAFRSHGG
jgi:LDH2 family malate/lactate/ureidoglycolate dehydrogenase